MTVEKSFFVVVHLNGEGVQTLRDLVRDGLRVVVGGVAGGLQAEGLEVQSQLADVCL